MDKYSYNVIEGVCVNSLSGYGIHTSVYVCLILCNCGFLQQKDNVCHDATGY